MHGAKIAWVKRGSTFLNPTAPEVAKLSKGPRGRGTTGRPANPMPFPRLLRGDTIVWCADL
jgi:hypothetical protein